MQGAGTPTNPWIGINGAADKIRNFANVTLNDSIPTGLPTMTVSYRGDPNYYGEFQSVALQNITWCL